METKLQCMVRFEAKTQPTYQLPIEGTLLTICRYVVGLVFGFEHLLLVVAVWLQWVIKPVPKWVRLAIARREYLNKQRMAAAAQS